MRKGLSFEYEGVVENGEWSVGLGSSYLNNVTMQWANEKCHHFAGASVSPTFSGDD